jgi:hypothetical protein
VINGWVMASTLCRPFTGYMIRRAIMQTVQPLPHFSPLSFSDGHQTGLMARASWAWW